MRDPIILLVHLIATLARLMGPGGLRSVVAESVLVKHQLLILNRSRHRSPNLRASDRILACVCALFMRVSRWDGPDSSLEQTAPKTRGSAPCYGFPYRFDEIVTFGPRTVPFTDGSSVGLAAGVLAYRRQCRSRGERRGARPRASFAGIRPTVCDHSSRLRRNGTQAHFSGLDRRL